MWVLIVLLAVAAVALFLVRKTSGMPEIFTVRRSTTIHASPEVIFALIQDFHRWVLWSPYEAYDPALKRTYSGAPAGKGAVYQWSGNAKVGAGSMEIVELAPASSLAIQLDFIRPFEAHNTAEFSLVPRGTETSVTWSMRGPNTPLAKVMSLFVDMDEMVGKDFEKGLARLKAVAEGPSSTVIAV